MRKLTTRIEISGAINTAPLRVVGHGFGDPDEGVFRVTLAFTEAAAGFHPFASSIWTASTSALFLRELDGAVNFLKMTGGNYTVERKVDFGRYGTLELAFAIVKDGETVVSKGFVNGDVTFPDDLEHILPIEETIVPAGGGTIIGHASGGFVARNGTVVQADVQSRYRFKSDEQLAGPELRRSHIRGQLEKNRLSLSYVSTIERVAHPPFHTLAFESDCIRAAFEAADQADRDHGQVVAALGPLPDLTTTL